MPKRSSNFLFGSGTQASELRSWSSSFTVDFSSFIPSDDEHRALPLRRENLIRHLPASNLDYFQAVFGNSDGLPFGTSDRFDVKL
jgi:hypothetical protein